MTPVERLRAADPAAALPPQPDERAEHDLRRLLAEGAAVPTPAPAVQRAVRLPVLVTAVVAILVGALTVGVLSVVHPRADEGGTTSSPTLERGVRPVFGAPCHPAEVLPFECGTYRSDYGAPSVTGSTGGPKDDPLDLSFSRQGGVLVLSASRVHGCLIAAVPVRYDGKRLVPLPGGKFGQGDCFGRGVDKDGWAWRFLHASHSVRSGSVLSADAGRDMVTFEYLGSAGIGQPQLPRNDVHGCVPAHVRPFPCGDYRSAGGTGSLAFLASDPYSLGFAHVNGELTASMSGSCNYLTATLEPDGDSVVAAGTGTTQILCHGDPAHHDDAVSAFVSGVLTYHVDGDTLTITKDSSTATFVRVPVGCLLQGSARWCGDSAAVRGTGVLAVIEGHPLRISLAAVQGRLTATLRGECETVTTFVRDRGTTLDLYRGSAKPHSCPSGAGTTDAEFVRFFDGSLTYRITGDTITFTNDGSTAAFVHAR